MLVPEWLLTELKLKHPGIEIRWVPYGRRKTFVLPMAGDAFWRLQAPVRLGGMVMHRRHISSLSDFKWQLAPRTYTPTTEEAPEARWVVFQVSMSGDVVKLFDVVKDTGELLPLDRRVLEAINHRDGLHGAHRKAITDVEAAPGLAEAAATSEANELTADLLPRIYHDVRQAATDYVVTKPDPTENEIEIVNGTAN